MWRGGHLRGGERGLAGGLASLGPAPRPISPHLCPGAEGTRRTAIGGPRAQSVTLGEAGHRRVRDLIGGPGLGVACLCYRVLIGRRA